MTDQGNSLSVAKGTDKTFIGLVIGFLIGMVVVTTWFFNYSFPGDDGTLINFVVIFFRELLILGIGTIISSYIAIKKIIGPNKPKKWYLSFFYEKIPNK